MDLTTLAADVQKVSARKELWGLKDAFTTWLEEWKQLIFSEVRSQTDFFLLINMMTKCVLQEVIVFVHIHGDEKLKANLKCS